MPEKDEIDAALGTEATVVTPGPGIYPGVPFETYRLWKAVNASLLCKLETKTPMHAKHYRDAPDEDTPAKLFGRATHAKVLEPETFAERCVIAPEINRRTNAGKDEWQRFLDTSANKMVLTPDKHEALLAIDTAIKGQRLYRLVQAGQAEVCLVWIDEDTQLLCKARLDYLIEVPGQAIFVIDFKTAEDASEWAFSYAIGKYGYHGQCAFYCMGIEALKGQTPGYTWLVGEKTPPYPVAAYQVQSATLDAGTTFCRRALRKYKHCLDTDTWPGYPDDVMPIDMPQKQFDREREMSRYQM